VLDFVAPWTAFRHKYRLLSWPWGKLLALRRLRQPRFELGLSARWDPRDHLLLWLLGAQRRLGFGRLKSEIFLTDPLPRPEPTAHRYEHWRALGRALELELPMRQHLGEGVLEGSREVLVHSGAAQPVRVWPLERYARLVGRLRQHHYRVQVACDPDQRAWWVKAGENDLAVPRTVKELMDLMDRAGAFIGNDSGPSHLAACCGVPTYTLFGPQLPEWFAPLHPQGELFEGKPCPYKPCSDYCRFPVAYCMANIGEEEVWRQLEPFLRRVLAHRALTAA
jgi:heptosyltransferase-2